MNAALTPAQLLASLEWRYATKAFDTRAVTIGNCSNKAIIGVKAALACKLRAQCLVNCRECWPTALNEAVILMKHRIVGGAAPKRTHHQHRFKIANFCR